MHGSPEAQRSSSSAAPDDRARRGGSSEAEAGGDGEGGRSQHGPPAKLPGAMTHSQVQSRPRQAEKRGVAGSIK